ncbi:hypothetical protein A3770_05p38420 [Chloropicon primus]|uniref:Uncharacterized protein n=1 Tax=Chloropicon primus TaxID=1764295 RepID=A0A5B8MMQ1_9CHLO|nr:hypothetical protein A3770_05p38420 [Chloropicon primus]|eukprot:QDZ21324.1 hypothetical protein A3770_05p38420 [Chloropicon primus]
MSRRGLVLVKEKLLEVRSERDLASKVRGRFAAVSANGYAYTATSNGAIVQSHLGKDGSRAKEVLYRIHEVRGQPVESSFRILRPFTTFQLATGRAGGDSENFVFTLAGQRRIMIAQVPQGVLNVAYQVHLLGSHAAPVTCTAIQNEDALLASYSSEDCLKVWDLESGAEMASAVRVSVGGVTSLGFGFRNKILSGDSDGTVCLWAVNSSTKSLTRLQNLRIPIGVMPISSLSACMVIERNHKNEAQAGERFMSKLWIGAGAEDGSFYVWSANGEEEKWDLVKSQQYVRSASIGCLHFDSVHNTLLVSGWSTIKTPAVFVYSIPSFKCIGVCDLKSPALLLEPRTRLQVVACLENLVVEKVAVPKATGKEAEERPEASISETIEAESPEASPDKSTGDSEATDNGGSNEGAVEPGEEAVRMASGPAPRQMPQEIQDLINKLKSKPSTVPGPQPRQVPKAVIDEVCSTSSTGAAVAARPAPQHAQTLGPRSSLRKEAAPAACNDLSLRSADEKKKKRKKKKKKAKHVEAVAKSTNELAQPRLCSTAMLRDKIHSMEDASFSPSEALVEECREKAVKKAMASSNVLVPRKISKLYNGLAPIIDKVPGKKVRKVGKQVDPSWAQSIKVKPKVTDCWRDRVPQICELEVKSVPSYNDLQEVHSRIAMF